MRIVRSALLAGVAAASLAAGGGVAQSDNLHVMNVRLPDGGVAQIRYAGNVAPQVIFSEAPASFASLTSPTGRFAGDPAFALLDRISAVMDREAAAMFSKADAMLAAANSGQLAEVAAHRLPAGSASYSFVSAMSGSGVCSESVEITATGSGPPRIVRHSSGDCSAAAARPGGAAVMVPAIVPPPANPPVSRPQIIETRAPRAAPDALAKAPPPRPDVIWTAANGAQPYRNLVREIPTH